MLYSCTHMATVGVRGLRYDFAAENVVLFTMCLGRLSAMTSSESDTDGESPAGGVFGSSLTSRLRHTGRAVAPCITRALQYINDSAAQTDGLFRRPGVLSRVQKLQTLMNEETGRYI